ncbi:MAG: protein kinase [Bacillota bacterium]|nr:protein kinase [Bacillota bacterium]
MEENKMVTLPGWETVRIIGSGSSGTVYELRKKDEYGGDFHTALKVISIPSTKKEYEEMKESLPEYALRAKLREKVEEISNEYRLMGVLKGHPNIVSCEDQMIIPHEDDMGWDIYIRMEMLTSLPEYVHENGITGSEVMKLGSDICSALEACKKNGIIHRDIKPQNIFVSKYGDFKLGDFGVAKATTMGSLDKVGTYSYMAPEVYKGKVYNESVDMYSLGMVLYWLLNERRGPFLPLGQQLPTDEQIADAHLRRYRGEAIPSPRNGNPALKQVVVKACAFKPENRFSSPTEMKKALTMAMQGRAYQSPAVAEDEPTVLEVVPIKKPSATPVKPAVKPSAAEEKPEKLTAKPKQNVVSPELKRKEAPKKPAPKPKEIEEEKDSNTALAVVVAIFVVIAILAAAFYFFGDELFDLGRRETAPTSAPTETVEPTYEVMSLILSSPSITVKEETEEKLDVSYIPELPQDADVKIVWKSSNNGVATVDEKGVVRGVSTGTATIRVYVEDHMDVYDECVVTVEKAKAVRIVIEKAADVQRYSLGDSLDLTGLELKVYYDNETERLITDPSEYKAEADLQGLGNRTVKITVDDATVEYTVWVGLF